MTEEQLKDTSFVISVNDLETFIIIQPADDMLSMKNKYEQKFNSEPTYTQLLGFIVSESMNDIMTGEHK